MSAAGNGWTPTVSSGFVGRPPGFVWMFASTSWLVLFLLPNAFGAWLAFLIIGIAVRRYRWLFAAAVYLALSIGLTFIPAPMPQAIFGAVLQAITLAHGIIAARTWLRILWGRRERGERLTGRGGRAASGGALRDRQRYVSAPALEVPEAAQGLFAEPGAQPGDYFAVQAPADAGPTAATGRAARATGSPGTPVDVNTATEAALAALPGMTRARARRAIILRTSAPFTSAQQFADALGLQAHEFARLRSAIVVPPLAKPRPSKRIRRLDV